MDGDRDVATPASDTNAASQPKEIYSAIKDSGDTSLRDSPPNDTCQPDTTPSTSSNPPPAPPPTTTFRSVHLRTTEDAAPAGLLPNLLSKLAPYISSKPAAQQREFVSNAIRTSKYTLLTFLPVNLCEQFSRVANMYFACIMLLQMIPGLSPIPWYTSATPLALVLAVNAVKEAYDDYFRHRSDRQVNSQSVKVLRKGGDKLLQWKELRVGDLVKVKINQAIPADIVLLSSSDPDQLCYVETANLDGETDLKVKYCYPTTGDMADAKDFEGTGFTIHCEQPNARLYNFEGAISRTDAATGQLVTDPLDVDNLLLRGCRLRKTQWVVGVVVFTGSETKIMRNQLRSPRKVTQLERRTNAVVAALLAALLATALLLAAAHESWEDTMGVKAWYLMNSTATDTWPDLGRGWGEYAVSLLRFLLLLAQMIPISMYVTLEMVKVLQCKLLYEKDREMYHKQSDTPLEARTTTLNEELGQVEYVLSDKTGTLTQNIMGFVGASIGGRIYGVGAPEAAAPHRALETLFSERVADDVAAADEAPSDTPHSIALNAAVRAALADGDAAADEFFTALALCNTVVPTANEKGELMYQAASPDEAALVQGSAYLGVKLLGRGAEEVELARRLTPGRRADLAARDGGCDDRDALETWDVLAVIEYNSDRKRMSTICRSPEGRIFLHCKGADTMLLERITPGQQLAATVKAHLEQMAAGGYRTLVVAQRELEGEHFQAWFKEWNAASAALDGRDAKMAAAAEAIERDMTLLGATAVEDKLQDGVPEALAHLLAMGIKVWVLTGDKVETAKSIAKTCRLITDGMTVLEVRADTLTQDDEKAEHVLAALAAGVKANAADAGLLIDGQALALCLADDATSLAFLQLCKLCKSVVCCRVSPMQKAQVTKLVKDKIGAITLGIGDGANDVSMIQEAHIGCGISGKEGRAACMASDFSFAQFRFVARLLLIHGRWSYKRCSEVIHYAFYKNLLYVLAHVWFTCFCGYSALAVFPAVFLATFNAFWAALPTIFYGLLDQDLPMHVIWSHPFLYKETQSQTRAKFFRQTGGWLLRAAWHSLVAFFVPYLALALGVSRGGLHASISMTGTASFTAMLLIVTLKVAMRSSYLTALSHAALWGPLLLWLPFLAMYENLWSWFPRSADFAADFKVFSELAGEAHFWLSVFVLAPVMALMLDAALEGFCRRLWPQNYEILQEYTALRAKAGAEEPLLDAPPDDHRASIFASLPFIRRYETTKVDSKTLSRSSTIKMQRKRRALRRGGVAAAAAAAVAFKSAAAWRRAKEAAVAKK